MSPIVLERLRSHFIHTAPRATNESKILSVCNTGGLQLDINAHPWPGGARGTEGYPVRMVRLSHTLLRPGVDELWISTPTIYVSRHVGCFKFLGAACWEQRARTQ